MSGIVLGGIDKALAPARGPTEPWLLCALAILPMLIVAGPQIYPETRLILALGISSWLAPWLARHPAGSRRGLVRSFPALLGLVIILAVSVFGRDWLKQRREAGRPLPPANSPNVLLIVLDTVRADRLSLYGYHRSTTPTLERLAKRGIRFDAARHAHPGRSCRTRASSPAAGRMSSTSNGRRHCARISPCWPSTWQVMAMRPRASYPMPLIVPTIPVWTAALLTTRIMCWIQSIFFERPLLGPNSEDGSLRGLPGFAPRPALLRTVQDFIGPQYDPLVRRDADSVNRGFLEWLDHRRDPERPFFVFLNYLDAHVPYKLPSGATHRFGQEPRTRDELRIVYDNWSRIDKLQLPKRYTTLAQDSYDSCVAYLDERLGRLFDDLGSRGVLDRTWVIIVGDHGEGLGEHDLYEHGESLYSTEIRVPLLILPPAGDQPGRVVRDTVSLRDLPATVVDLVGLKTGAPFPGRSLSRLWENTSQRTDQAMGDDVLSELPSPSPRDSSHGRSPAHGAPSFPWPNMIWSTSRTKAMGPRNYTTSASIRVS